MYVIFRRPFKSVRLGGVAVFIIIKGCSTIAMLLAKHILILAYYGNSFLRNEESSWHTCLTES